MKKLIVGIVAVLLLSGCAAIEIADMIFDDDHLDRGTVAVVAHNPNNTVVMFEGGGGEQYFCESAKWVEVGDYIEVRNVPAGLYGSESTNPGYCVFSR